MKFSLCLIVLGYYVDGLTKSPIRSHSVISCSYGRYRMLFLLLWTVSVIIVGCKTVVLSCTDFIHI